jgi:hypothetical protein
LTDFLYLSFMQKINDKEKRSWLYPVSLALVSAALFGAATPASKALLGDLSAFQLAGLLYLGAAAGVLVVLVRKRSWRPPYRSQPSFGISTTTCTFTKRWHTNTHAVTTITIIPTSIRSRHPLNRMHANWMREDVSVGERLQIWAE